MRWKISEASVEYAEALSYMETKVSAIRAGEEEEVWLLEHPPLYTAGTSAKKEDLIDPKCFPVFETGRGGQFTYHGPGQRVGYVMLDLKQRSSKPDIRLFVKQLEQWIINTLAAFDIKGEVREGRIGVWVELPNGKEAKIAALGIRVRQWVSYHGIAINVHPDLSHYAGIIPCGISEHGVTSLHDLGVKATMQEVDSVLQSQFEKIF
jgi:lipoyl(octanoyl) transferase